MIFSEELKPAECVFNRTSASQLVETFLKCVCVCVLRYKATVFLSCHSAGQHYVCPLSVAVWVSFPTQPVVYETRFRSVKAAQFKPQPLEFLSHHVFCLCVEISIKTLNHSLESGVLLSGAIKCPHSFFVE